MTIAGGTPHGSKLPEPAVELSVVVAVHVAVPIEVEVPQVADVGDARSVRGPERLAILPVRVAVAVRVAEQPGEAVCPIAARRSVAVSVQRAAPAVLDEVRVDRQRVTAVR